MRKALLLPLLFVSATVVAAAPAMRGVVEARHADAPEQLDQFAFIVGDWDCKTRFMKPDGTGYNESTARWSGSWILGGFAIQDIWESPGGYGTNLRSWNPRSEKWDNRWLAGGQWKYYESEQVGETMVMTGGEGKDPRGAFIDRNTFYEIGEDGWRWRKDRSYDGGESWVEGIGFIEATRRVSE